MKLTVYEDGRVCPKEAPVPSFLEDEVLFRVKACGICGSDLPRVFSGKAYYYPIVLGHEFSGVVEDAADSSLVGGRYCVFPILPCGKCEFCRREQYANCVHYDYYGSRRDGGMQDLLAVKKKNLVPLPTAVTFEAGAMTEPVAVCLHAVKKAGIRKGDTVLIYGAGTIGILCGMWARTMGADEILFFDVREERLAQAVSLGFSVYDGQEKADAVLEASGAGAAFSGAVRNVKAFGHIVLVGNAGRDLTLQKEDYAQILRKQLTISGSWNSDFGEKVNDWHEALAAMATGEIHPEKLITHRFPLSQGQKAFELIKEGAYYQKMILTGDEP